jgi:membrane associated rhomboid family serine protease
MRRICTLVLIAALVIPHAAHADNDEPRSLAMIDGGVPMILVGAVGASLLTAWLPSILQAPADGCCGGVTDENRGLFLGVTIGAAASFAAFVGGIILVYFGAQHRGKSNAVITASASGFGFRF